MLEYKRRGRPWERRESAIAEQRCMVDEEQCELCQTRCVYGRTGKPGVPRPVDDLQMRDDS